MELFPPLESPLTPKLWLEIATYRLAPEAAARVRAEYLAHLEDALEAGETAQNVLREWGDPHRANDALGKAHLTVADRGALHSGYALSVAGWRRAMFEEGEWGRSGVLLTLPLLFGTLREFVTPQMALLSLCLLILLLPTLRWLLIAGLRLEGVARQLLAWLLSGWGSVTLLLGLVLWQVPEGRIIWLGPCALFAAFWLWRLWVGLRALSKPEAYK